MTIRLLHVLVPTDRRAAALDAQDIDYLLTAEERYRAVRLVSVSAEFAGPGDDATVSVVVQRPADDRYPRLPDRVRDRIAERTGRTVAVSVELVDRWTAG